MRGELNIEYLGTSSYLIRTYSVRTLGKADLGIIKHNMKTKISTYHPSARSYLRVSDIQELFAFFISLK